MIIRTELITLADSLKVELPVWYLNLVDDFGGKPWSAEEVWSSPDMIRDMNKGFRTDGAWGCEWRDHYWAFGGDGAGGIYFIDTEQSESLIYYIDHEDPPKDISDTDHISILTLADFKSRLIADEEDYKQHCMDVRDKITHRRWWQFWIPKQVPLWAQEKDGD